MGGQPGIIKKLVDKLCARHRIWISGLELRPLYPLLSQSILSLLKGRPDDDFAPVCGKFRISRSAIERAFVEPVDKRAGLLKLQLDEEGRTDVDPLAVNAGRVSPALSKLAGPVAQAARVRLAVEEISVMPGDERLRIVNGIRESRLTAPGSINRSADVELTLTKA